MPKSKPIECKHVWKPCKTTINTILLQNKGTFSVNNVPAKRCTKCGECRHDLCEFLEIWKLICKEEIRAIEKCTKEGKK